MNFFKFLDNFKKDYNSLNSTIETKYPMPSMTLVCVWQGMIYQYMTHPLFSLLTPVVAMRIINLLEMIDIDHEQ